MNEELVDFLAYLLQQYMQLQHVSVLEKQELLPELSNTLAGEIETMLVNISMRKLLIHQESSAKQRQRCYSPHEIEKISTEARNFLLFLEQSCVLSESEREAVLHHAMISKSAYIDISQLYDMVMMILLNQPELKTMGYSALLLNNNSSTLH